MAADCITVMAADCITVMAADCIYVVEGGCIVEYGTNEQLLSLNGVYKNLYDRQFKNKQD
jgi:ABC-type multidrug transport system fused ATPase/permease subunit